MVGAYLAARGPAVVRSAFRPRRAAPLVVVDPGHGGKDPGASAYGQSEDPINLEVGLRVGSALRRMGYRVLLTRRQGCLPFLLAVAPSPAPDAVPDGRCRLNLRARVALAVAAHAGMFVSIHCDRFADGSVRGPRVYYAPGGAEGLRLARRLQAELDAFRGRPGTPVAADYYVLMHLTDMPSTVVELGYLTNHEERRELLEPAYQRRIAAAIARGVRRFSEDTALSRVLPAAVSTREAPGGR